MLSCQTAKIGEETKSAGKGKASLILALHVTIAQIYQSSNLISDGVIGKRVSKHTTVDVVVVYI